MKKLFVLLIGMNVIVPMPAFFIRISFTKTELVMERKQLMLI